MVGAEERKKLESQLKEFIQRTENEMSRSRSVTGRRGERNPLLERKTSINSTPSPSRPRSTSRRRQPSLDRNQVSNQVRNNNSGNNNNSNSSGSGGGNNKSSGGGGGNSSGGGTMVRSPLKIVPRTINSPNSSLIKKTNSFTERSSLKRNNSLKRSQSLKQPIQNERSGSLRRRSSLKRNNSLKTTQNQGINRSNSDGANSNSISGGRSNNRGVCNNSDNNSGIRNSGVSNGGKVSYESTSQLESVKQEAVFKNPSQNQKQSQKIQSSVYKDKRPNSRLIVRKGDEVDINHEITDKHHDKHHHKHHHAHGDKEGEGKEVIPKGFEFFVSTRTDILVKVLTDREGYG